jgi:hypothetical protein
MSPKAKAQLAREHLDRALPAVEAEDFTEAVTWLFVALEAAIAAIADKHGMSTPPKHWRKVEIAEQLFSEGHISVDFGPVLRTLNDARKEAIYEGEEPGLGGQSLEDVAADVETAVGIAEAGS